MGYPRADEVFHIAYQEQLKKTYSRLILKENGYFQLKNPKQL